MWPITGIKYHQQIQIYANSPVRGSFMGRQAVHWFWCGSYLSMLDRCDTPLWPPTTYMKPSMTPTPKLILLSAMGATISQASLLVSYRSTLCEADTVLLTTHTMVYCKDHSLVTKTSQLNPTMTLNIKPCLNPQTDPWRTIERDLKYINTHSN